MPGPLRTAVRSTLLCGLALTIATPAALSSAGQKPAFLKFEQGSEEKATTIAKVAETLEIDSIGMAKQPRSYLVRGLTGQSLTLRLQGEPGTRLLFSCPGSSSYAVIEVTKDAPFSLLLPESGDYLLQLQAEGAKEKTSFPVSFEVELYTRRRPVPPSATGLYGRNGGEEAMIDVAQGEDGSVRFYLYAFWKGGQLPEIVGRTPIDQGAATFKDGDCALSFQFKDDRLDIQGTGSCPQGAQEAVFGTYRRLSHCGWPRTPGG